MSQGVQTRFSWILPILEPEYVVNQTLRAIQQDQEVLCMPVIVYLVPILRGILPTSVFDFGLDVLGVCCLLTYRTATNVDYSFCSCRFAIAWIRSSEEPQRTLRLPAAKIHIE